MYDSYINPELLLNGNKPILHIISHIVKHSLTFKVLTFSVKQSIIVSSNEERNIQSICVCPIFSKTNIIMIGNQYCIMTFSPVLSYTRYKDTDREEVRYINQALMLFEQGRHIKDDEMTSYCKWFCDGNGDSSPVLPAEEPRPGRIQSGYPKGACGQEQLHCPATAAIAEEKLRRSWSWRFQT